MAGSNLFTPISSTCWVALSEAENQQNNGNQLAMLAKCTGTPPTTAGTFEHGCIMIQTNSGTGNPAVYQNTGTTASPSWELVGSGSPYSENQVFLDNVEADFGTDIDMSLAWRTTGVGASTNMSFLGLSKAIAVGLQANKGFDPVGINASGFLQDPTIFWLSGDQSQTQWVMQFLDNSQSQFNLNGASGDTFGGTLSNDPGVSFSFQAGDGGSFSTGGDGGGFRIEAGDGKGSMGNGGDIVIRLGDSESALHGNFEFRLGDGNIVSYNAADQWSFVLADDVGGAFTVGEGSNTYISINTSNGNETISLGNTTTDPDFLFSSEGTFSVTGDLLLGGNGAAVAGGHIVIKQFAEPVPTVDAGMNNGGSGASVVMLNGASDTAGWATVTAGNGTPLAGGVCSIAFQRPFTGASGGTPIAQVIPTNAAAWAAGLYCDDTDDDNFTVVCRNAPAANDVMTFSYIVLATT